MGPWIRTLDDRRHRGKEVLRSKRGDTISRWILVYNKVINRRFLTAIMARVWFQRANIRTRSDNSNSFKDVILLLAANTSRWATNPLSMRPLCTARVPTRTTIRRTTKEAMVASIEAGRQPL